MHKKKNNNNKKPQKLYAKIGDCQIDRQQRLNWEKSAFGLILISIFYMYWSYLLAVGHDLYQGRENVN